MDTLSINKKILTIISLIIILVAAASFAAGYLYRGQEQRAPIIIEKSNEIFK